MPACVGPVRNRPSSDRTPLSDAWRAALRTEGHWSTGTIWRHLSRWR